MDAYSRIRQEMARSFGAGRPTMLGKVTEVDREGRTCTVDDGGAVYYGVRLQCVAGGDRGLVLFPAVGAYVLAVRVENGGQWAVLCASETESWRMDIGDMSVEMDGGAIVFNGGTVGATKTDVLTQRLNALERQCNSLLTTLSGITVPPEGGLAFAPLFSDITALPETKMEEIEDTAVKH